MGFAVISLGLSYSTYPTTQFKKQERKLSTETSPPMHASSIFAEIGRTWHNLDFVSVRIKAKTKCKRNIRCQEIQYILHVFRNN